MRRLVQFFIGSSLVFLVILSVFNLALFLETAKLAETGLDGSFMVEDVFPILWKAFGVLGALFLVHFAASAVIAAVYWLCWRPSRRERAEVLGENPQSIFGEPRPLSPFFAALFALVVLFPLLMQGIGGAFNDVRTFLERRIAPTPALEAPSPAERPKSLSDETFKEQRAYETSESANK